MCFFYSCKRMFCVYHSILMHLTAPKRGIYKKGIINWFQSQWCWLCDAILLTAYGSGTCRDTIVFTETSSQNHYFFFIYTRTDIQYNNMLQKQQNWMFFLPLLSWTASIQPSLVPWWQVKPYTKNRAQFATDIAASGQSTIVRPLKCLILIYCSQHP